MIQFIGSWIQIMKMFSLYQRWGGAEGLESSFRRAVHGKIGSYRSLSASGPAIWSWELARKADSTQKACLDFDYSLCPVRWFWLTSVLVPFGLIREPSPITPPYALNMETLYFSETLANIYKCLWGQNFTNHALNFHCFWKPKIKLLMFRLLIFFMLGIM